MVTILLIERFVTPRSKVQKNIVEVDNRNILFLSVIVKQKISAIGKRRCFINRGIVGVILDGTFYIAPTFGYQVFITRVYAPEINSFYTTSLSILNNKEQSTYEFKYNNNIIITPKILHCDFEKGIFNAAIKIFPNITIKYCVWHYKRSLKIQKYKLCYNEIYLYKYDIQCWDYYNDINHITNNASESFNNYLKKLFYKKPSFYELIYHLKKEESLSYNNYKWKIGGV
ncbi:hypothetical protein BCR32DRAFT_286558 [Anaeromyces robustus]|uniref:MULE transposase domain-containing protein n=1 Tax=Anaeromyces robustus TaxID=1754192 RepID=A0A1Y1VVL2_9FUNG|nr:hypothetical protein BCR32DRAFT_286558 [Anaeromyces robustus]|eukprot:ORX65339.1 hypothetical protein BCR32DRAFT_286558 [Anaeromyces robustus]